MKIHQLLKMSKQLKFKYHIDNTLPGNIKDYIFVFGSNISGIHGKGAALEARRIFGAKIGIGYGLTGQSFAVPTKDKRIITLPLNEIKKYIDKFITFTHEHSELSFWVTRIGCGLAGYSNKDIAPLFKQCNINCNFPIEWKEFLEDQK